MERFLPLLLEIWREACRHIELGEAAERMLPLLARRLPVDRLLVRRLELPRGLLGTVAEATRAPRAPLPATRSPLAGPALERLVAWVNTRSVLRGSAAQITERLPDSLPEGLSGQLLVGGLRGTEGPLGVLILARAGARAFPPEHEALAAALLEPFTVAVENDQRLRELRALREAAEADRRSLLTRLGRQEILDTIVGQEGGLHGVMARLHLVAQTDLPVLLLGETGTGKEVIARALHTRSPRAAAPFLRVNCGAIPAELIDSELFGHERGSFTGAASLRQGWFERADGGTLFLDEVAELSLAAQVRLLRILQDGSFQRVGGQRQLSVDVRVVAATHRDLASMVQEGRFREDLWYRIAVFPIRLPALRERLADIPALADHFARRAATRLGLSLCRPSPEDLALLAAYPWPGNIREFGSVLERAAILGEGRRLEVAAALGLSAPLGRRGASAAILAPPAGDAPWLSLDAAMARHVEAALRHCGGRIEGPHGAARLLGINPYTLRSRMRKLGLDWHRFRRPPDP